MSVEVTEPPSSSQAIATGQEQPALFLTTKRQGLRKVKPSRQLKAHTELGTAATCPRQSSRSASPAAARSLQGLAKS